MRGLSPSILYTIRRDALNNVCGEAVISAETSPVTVRVIPPAEDLIIVNHVVRLLAN